MNTDDDTTQAAITRFNAAFETHRPDDPDGLIGEGCVLESTAPALDGTRYERRDAALSSGK